MYSIERGVPLADHRGTRVPLAEMPSGMELRGSCKRDQVQDRGCKIYVAWFSLRCCGKPPDC